MKINKACKLELAVSEDPFRRAVVNILIEKQADGSALAIATNGRMLAVVPCEIENDGECGLLSPKGLTEARKASRKYSHRLEDGTDAVSVTLNGTIDLVDGVKLPRPVQSESQELEKEPNAVPMYPNWRQVVPAEGTPYKIKIGLNADLLHKLAHALGAENGEITIEIEEDILNPVRVTPLKNPGAYGVLMPVRIV